MTPLVSVEWLATHLRDQNLVVCDCTAYLPTEAKNAAAEFAIAHIPGARLFDIDVIADTDTDLPHMAPSPGRFARLVGQLGVSNASTVVFYDQKGLFSAARGWWMMRLFGHDAAAVLDGGLPAWRRAEQPVEAGPPAIPASVTFRPDYHPRLLRGIGDMIANVTSREELVLDARAAGRFDASVPEPRAGMRGGHIPGARSVPFTELLRPDFTMRTPDELRARLAIAGANGLQPVVTSCGTGVTAAVITLAMAVAGLPIGALYDGAWTEWGGRPDTPVET